MDLEHHRHTPRKDGDNWAINCVSNWYKANEATLTASTFADAVSEGE